MRSAVLVRDAVPDDVEALRLVFAGSAGPLADEPSDEAASSVAATSADPDQRLLVAAVDGIVVGAVHLARASLTPLQAGAAIHVSHLHVLEGHRRHGVGTALMEAAVSWAEEKGTPHLIAVASATSRDANRFMARLGLGQIGVVRAANVATLRAKLPVEAPAVCLTDGRHQRTVGRVLARRRSLRRRQVETP